MSQPAWAAISPTSMLTVAIGGMLICDQCPSSALLQPLADLPSDKRSNKRRKVEGGEPIRPGCKYKQEAKCSLAVSSPDDEQRSFFRILTNCIEKRDVNAEKLGKDLEVEVYRLAEKDPDAFPEIFSTVSSTADDMTTQQKLHGTETTDVEKGNQDPPTTAVAEDPCIASDDFAVLEDDGASWRKAHNAGKERKDSKASTQRPENNSAVAENRADSPDYLYGWNIHQNRPNSGKICYSMQAFGHCPKEDNSPCGL